MAGQGDDAVFGFHADVFGMDRGLPVEFGQDVLLELEIGFHRVSFKRLRGIHGLRCQ